MDGWIEAAWSEILLQRHDELQKLRGGHIYFSDHQSPALVIRLFHVKQPKIYYERLISHCFS